MSNRWLWLVFVLMIAGCSRPEGETARISLRLPAATQMVHQKTDLVSQSVADWNASLGIGAINQINCWMVFVDVPETTAKRQCVDGSSTTAFSYTQFVGGVVADGRSIEIELPMGAKRAFRVVGLRSAAGDLAEACRDFSSAPARRSKFSPPVLVGQAVADLSAGENSVAVSVSMAGAKTLSSCETGLQTPPAGASLALSSLVFSPSSPGTSANPTLTGLVSGQGTVEVSLHVSAVCTDAALVSASPVAAGSTFSLVLPNLVEGIHHYHLKALDSTDQVACVPVSYTRDLTAPALTASPADLTAPIAPVFSGTCETGSGNVQITGAATSSAACVAGSWTYTPPDPGSDGTYAYTFTQTDAAGNAATVTRNWTRSAALPAFAATSALSVTSNSAPTFAGTCDSGLSVAVTGAQVTTLACSSGTWSFTPSAGTDGIHIYTIGQTNAAGASSQNFTWTRDTVPPVAATFSIVEGASVTNPLIHLNLTGNDARGVLAYCIRHQSAAPPSDHPCWKTVEPAQTSFAIANDPVLIGYNAATYDLYAFLQDAAGNISVQSQTVGVDKVSITYSIPLPAVENVLISSTNLMSGSANDLSGTVSSPLYVRWKLVGPADPNGISIESSTDEKNWTSFATGLSDGNNGCIPDEGSSTFDDGSTGCKQISVPSSGPFRIRVRASRQGLIAGGYSRTFNGGGFTEIAGRPGTGIDMDGSLLKVSTIPIEGYQSDSGALAVDPNGNLFIRDIHLGIIMINSFSRVATVIGRKTGTYSGEGGPYLSATLRNPLKIGADADGNLYVLDVDRILKVTRSSGTIQTIVGGGADSTLTTKPATALSLDFTSSSFSGPSGMAIMAMTFQVLPNGDILFVDRERPQSPTPARPFLWYYSAADQTVTPKILSGTGYSQNAGTDVSTCTIQKAAAALGPGGTIDHVIGALTSCPSLSAGFARLNAAWESTGPHTGAPDGVDPYFTVVGSGDGRIYGVDVGAGKIHRYNPATSSWVLIAGSGPGLPCPDGTMATACTMKPSNVSVTASGALFFIDQGLVRMIQANGTVTTVFGRPWTAGDGQPGLLAEFSTPHDLGAWGGSKLVVLDSGNLNMREMNLSNGLISTIAGTGTVAAPVNGAPALSGGLGHFSQGHSFAIDPSGGHVFWKGSSALMKLDRSSGNWATVVGGGGTPYDGADGQNGSNISLTGYLNPLIFGGSQIFTHLSNMSHANVAIKSYNPGSSYQQSPVLYKSGSYVSSLCVSGTAANDCGNSFPENGSIRMAYAPAYGPLLAQKGSSSIRHIPSSQVQDFATISGGIQGFTYADHSSKDFIYACTTSGALIRYNRTDNIQSSLTLPSGVTCHGNRVIADPGAQKIFFLYRKGAIVGIGSVPW